MQENQLINVLTREGVLIHVSVRYWRATKKLRPEDLGLDPESVTDRLISLGHKKLLPKENLQAFALVESRTHSLIESSTFPFLNGLGRFLPNRKLQEVTEKLKAMETEFHNAKRCFLDEYAQLRDQATDEWLTAARRLVADPEQMVALIEASFPAPEKMGRFFGFETQLFQIRVPENLDLELVGTADQQEIARAREQAARAAESQIHQGMEEFVGECVGALRQQTSQLCQEMLESMRSGKTGVHQRTLNRLIRFIDEFKKLNFANDREMESKLDQVRQEFLTRSAEDYRADEVARSRLKQGLQGLADHARDLAQQDTRELVERFGQLGQRRFHLVA